MKKTGKIAVIMTVMMLAASLTVYAAGGQETDDQAVYGQGWGYAQQPGGAFGGRGGRGRGPGMAGGYGAGYGMAGRPLADREELPEMEEVTLSGTFTYIEGIPALKGDDGKTYNVMIPAVQIAASEIVNDGDKVTVEGLLCESFPDAPLQKDGNLIPQKVTVGDQTYILPPHGPGFRGRGRTVLPPASPQS